MERWVGKVAIVTGASSGIGEAIAESLVKHGMKVVGLARRADRLQGVEKRLQGEKGKFFPLKCDLKEEDEILSAFRWVEENLGGVHVLVNNAGASKVQKVEGQSTDDMNDILKVNVIALQTCSREAIKSMKSHNVNDGHVINISSVLAHVSSPPPGLAMYYASKKAVNAVSEGLRVELAAEKSDIRVSTISPGLVETEILEGSGLKLPREVLDITLKSPDIAAVVIFILQLPPYAVVTELVIQTVRNIREAINEAAKRQNQ